MNVWDMFGISLVESVELSSEYFSRVILDNITKRSPTERKKLVPTTTADL